VTIAILETRQRGERMPEEILMKSRGSVWIDMDYGAFWSIVFLIMIRRDCDQRSKWITLVYL